MDTGSILISLLVFLVFYQVIVRFSKKSPLAKVNSGEQMELLIEKFERLDRAFKYEINDMEGQLLRCKIYTPHHPKYLSY